MASRTSVSGEDGVQVNYKGLKVALDPRRAPRADFAFVSHAHIDHVHTPSKSVTVLASGETTTLARERGFDLGETYEYWDGFQLIDSGHILGSRGLLIHDEVFYTSDFATRPRAFLGKGRAVKCKVLIVESTYGRSRFRFPSVASIVEQANKLISDLFSKGKPVVLMGYPLGKAQILTYLFSSWAPIYVHGSVARMNRVCAKLGVDIRDDLVGYSEASEKGLLSQRPWILIAPMHSGRSLFIKSLKEKYGAVTVAFSGWSAEPSFRNVMSVDYALPLSDHCDFDDLVSLVEHCSPEKVYTVHGFASDFAAHLQRMGFDATPLLGVQESLSDYLKG